ncbi:uncharacterized protein CC84DRAFT_735151 [Paraphaeosphaeria sporulosa]|uniref:Uncharacterized protein n=1 Tax=Paraphaeosphaeria sporulosa TaxID=1460663 RepID=A0A177CDQ7_9PLEO|nr:uncharacterized protein CC84DRAFT_735151 [Paraphaeosphaeria sporulosa]OAG05774.1 hypothetical protein CC84DRAFT_735151 [Paraphaeosphaeria sporulosa]
MRTHAFLFLAAAVPVVAYLDCAACGGNIFKDNREIWTGYLLQVAGQLGINIRTPYCNGSDIYETIVNEGGGMCVNFPGKIDLPAPAYACFDASTVKPPQNATSTCTNHAAATEYR